MSKLDKPELQPQATGKVTQGRVEIFTGGGKGKTSAALGLALRAAGHGLKVHIVFFMKGDFPYGEQQALVRLPGVSFQRFGTECFVDPACVQDVDREQAHLALEAGRQVLRSGQYDVLILDEVLVASAWELIPVEEVAELIREKPENLELVLTGRYAHPKLIEMADLVTEMREIKHPYQQGILSRAGIDY